MFDAKYFTERLRDDAREMRSVSVTVFLSSGARFLAKQVLAADSGCVVFQAYPIDDGEPLGQKRWLERMAQRGADAPLERIAVAYETISHVHISNAAPGDAATVGFHVT